MWSVADGTLFDQRKQRQSGWFTEINTDQETRSTKRATKSEKRQIQKKQERERERERELNGGRAQERPRQGESEQ